MKRIIILFTLILSFCAAISQEQDLTIGAGKLEGLLYNTKSGNVDTIIAPDPDSLGQFKIKNVADPIDILDAVNLRTLNKNTFVGFDNVLIVSQSGNYDANTITAAMDSITDASASNTYAVWVMEGDYTTANGETFPIVMKDYVTIIGFDDDLARVSGSESSLFTLASEKSSIRDISITHTPTTSGYTITGTNTSSTAENKIQNCDMNYITSTSGVSGGFIDVQSDGNLIIQDVAFVYQNLGTGIIANAGLMEYSGDLQVFFDTNILFGFSNCSGGDIYIFDNYSTNVTTLSNSLLSFTILNASWNDEIMGWKINTPNSVTKFSVNTVTEFNGAGNGTVYGAYSNTGGTSVVDLNTITFKFNNFANEYFAWAGSEEDEINGIFANGLADNPTGSGIGGAGTVRKTVIENNNFVTNQKFIDENMRLDINSTNQSLNDLFNIIASSGWVSGGDTLTDNLDGTVDINAGTGLIRTSDDEQAPIKMFDWAATAGLTLVDGAANLVYVDYNSGSPIVATTTNKDLIYDNENNLFELYEVVREGTTLHISDHRHRAKNTVSKIQELLYAIAEIRWTDGLTIAGTGTRNITVTEGQLWVKLNDIDVAALNTSTGGTYDSYYRDGVGGFTKLTGQTQWDNAQYDDGTGTLINYTNGRYGYMDFYIDADGEMAAMYGQAQYTSEVGATAADEASPLPVRLQEHAIRIGRVTFEELTDIGTFISYFETQAEGGGDSPTDHNLLSNLNGSSPYNHLSSQELANVQELGTGASGNLFESDGVGGINSVLKNTINVGGFNDDGTYMDNATHNAAALTGQYVSTDASQTISGQKTHSDILWLSGVDNYLGFSNGGYIRTFNRAVTPSGLTSSTGAIWHNSSDNHLYFTNNVESFDLTGGGDMTKAVYDPANINEQLVGITATQTLTNKTLTTPTIADFTNSTHDHTTNANGGLLDASDITNAVTTNTIQSITGLKTFTSDLTIGGNLVFQSGDYIRTFSRASTPTGLTSSSGAIWHNSGDGHLWFTNNTTSFDLTASGGGGAPVDATYITQTATATLTNEQALSSLSSGFMKVTTGTGVVSSQSQISLASDVTGNLPVTNLNSGTSASSSTFWRGDGIWATPAGGGNVSNVGTPVANQLAIWASATTIGGDAGLTFSSGELTVSNNVLASYYDVTENATVTTPPSGVGRYYFKTDGKPYAKNDAGTEYDLSASGGSSLWQDLTGEIAPATIANEVLIKTTTDRGAYGLQVAADVYIGDGSNEFVIDFADDTDAMVFKYSYDISPSEFMRYDYSDGTSFTGLVNADRFTQDHAAAQSTSGTINIDTRGNASSDLITLTGNSTLNLNYAQVGQRGSVLIRQDATGSRTLVMAAYAGNVTSSYVDLYSGGLQNINLDASSFTKIQYEIFSTYVTFDVIWYE
jgi:hypothetical protein